MTTISRANSSDNTINDFYAVYKQFKDKIESMLSKTKFMNTNRKLLSPEISSQDVSDSSDPSNIDEEMVETQKVLEQILYNINIYIYRSFDKHNISINDKQTYLKTRESFEEAAKVGLLDKTINDRIISFINELYSIVTLHNGYNLTKLKKILTRIETSINALRVKPDSQSAPPDLKEALEFAQEKADTEIRNATNRLKDATTIDKLIPIIEELEALEYKNSITDYYNRLSLGQDTVIPKESTADNILEKPKEEIQKLIEEKITILINSKTTKTILDLIRLKDLIDEDDNILQYDVKLKEKIDNLIVKKKITEAKTKAKTITQRAEKGAELILEKATTELNEALTISELISVIQTQYKQFKEYKNTQVELYNSKSYAGKSAKHNLPIILTEKLKIMQIVIEKKIKELIRSKETTLKELKELINNSQTIIPYNQELFARIQRLITEKESLLKQSLVSNPIKGTITQKEILPPQIIEATSPVLTITQDLKAVEAAEAAKKAEQERLKKEAEQERLEKAEKEAEARLAEARLAEARLAEARLAEAEARLAEAKRKKKAEDEAAAKKKAKEEAAAIAKQIIKASPSASLTQKEILPPQIIEATSPSASLTQKEILPPQIIKASPSASLTQKEIQSPQIIKATPSASLTQKEIQPQSNKTTDKPQIIQTTPSDSLTVKEIKTPSNQSINNPELSISKSIELAEKIIKLLKEQEIPTIYAYYLYFNCKDTKQEIIKEIETNISNSSKYKEKYENICDAVNRLMIYLTATAKEIKVNNYTDETLCDEYNIYFDTLVFTDKVLDKINTDTAKQELTKKYITALNKELPSLFKNIKDKAKLIKLLTVAGGDNNYKTMINNIFNYTESSDESDILYDSDISEESIISIRSDYSEDLITPLLTPQT